MVYSDLSFKNPNLPSTVWSPVGQLLGRHPPQIKIIGGGTRLRAFSHSNNNNNNNKQAFQKRTILTMNRHKGARGDAEPGLTLIIYKYVFSECLKQSSEMVGSRIYAQTTKRSSFQAARPDVENARGPKLSLKMPHLLTYLNIVNKSMLICCVECSECRRTSKTTCRSPAAHRRTVQTASA